MDETPVETPLEAEAVVVAAEAHELAPVRSSELVPAQAAAVAAGSFVAGVVTMAVVKRHSARRAAKRRPKKTLDMLPIVGSRSFLVDVHLIGRD